MDSYRFTFFLPPPCCGFRHITYFKCVTRLGNKRVFCRRFLSWQMEFGVEEAQMEESRAVFCQCSFHPWVQAIQISHYEIMKFFLDTLSGGWFLFLVHLASTWFVLNAKSLDIQEMEKATQESLFELHWPGISNFEWNLCAVGMLLFLNLKSAIRWDFSFVQLQWISLYKQQVWTDVLYISETLRKNWASEVLVTQLALSHEVRNTTMFCNNWDIWCIVWNSCFYCILWIACLDFVKLSHLYVHWQTS